MYVYLNDVVQGFQARDFRDVYRTLTLTHTHTHSDTHTHTNAAAITRKQRRAYNIKAFA